jgi:hypothetical protein
MVNADAYVNGIELCQVQDLTRPFLLAFETKHAKMVTISMNCIQRLISSNAIATVFLTITPISAISTKQIY